MRFPVSARVLISGLLAITGWAIGASAVAQEFPVKPVKIVVPFGPGVGAEVATRVLADLLVKELGQQVIVENRPGASSMIGVNYVAQAPKDGYTVLMLNIQQYNNHLMYRNVTYKPSDFIPFAGGGILALVMMTNKNVPATSMRDFVQYAKARPGALNFGYWGAGGSPHVMGIRMQSRSEERRVGKEC